MGLISLILYNKLNGNKGEPEPQCEEIVPLIKIRRPSWGFGCPVQYRPEFESCDPEGGDQSESDSERSDSEGGMGQASSSAVVGQQSSVGESSRDRPRGSRQQPDEPDPQHQRCSSTSSKPPSQCQMPHSGEPTESCAPSEGKNKNLSSNGNPEPPQAGDNDVPKSGSKNPAPRQGEETSPSKQSPRHPRTCRGKSVVGNPELTSCQSSCCGDGTGGDNAPPCCFQAETSTHSSETPLTSDKGKEVSSSGQHCLSHRDCDHRITNPDPYQKSVPKDTLPDPFQTKVPQDQRPDICQKKLQQKETLPEEVQKMLKNGCPPNSHNNVILEEPEEGDGAGSNGQAAVPCSQEAASNSGSQGLSSAVN